LRQGAAESSRAQDAGQGGAEAGSGGGWPVGHSRARLGRSRVAPWPVAVAEMRYILLWRGLWRCILLWA
jgi:hypothetical protein